jgi:hypothetical protein
MNLIYQSNLVLSADQGQIDSLQSYENKYGSMEVWKCGSKCAILSVFLFVC